MDLPFFAKNPQFSVLLFDTNLKFAIDCMYPFGICNNFIDFDSLDNLNVSAARLEVA
jgi:hypothetical protein